MSIWHTTFNSRSFWLTMKRGGVTAETYTGDMANDDSDLHNRLWAQNKGSAFRLYAYRTQKKGRDKEVSKALLAAPEYQAGFKERSKIERKFGEGNCGIG